MGNDAKADLVIITDDKGQDLMDTRRAMRLLYGDGGTFIGVQSHEELVAQLGRYSYIGRLVITLHGSKGTINIRGYGHDLEQYADDFKAAHIQTKVNEIFFESCNVGNDPPGVVAFMKPLKAFHATALTVFHGWQFYQIKPGTKPADTLLIGKREDYEAVKPYLMPGQPQLRDIAKHRKTERLMYEHFSRHHLDGHELENMLPGRRERDVWTRDQVKPRIVPVGKAGEVKVDEFFGPTERLIFEDIKNAPPSPTPRSVPPRR